MSTYLILCYYSMSVKVWSSVDVDVNALELSSWLFTKCFLLFLTLCILWEYQPRYALCSLWNASAFCTKWYFLSYPHRNEGEFGLSALFCFSKVRMLCLQKKLQKNSRFRLHIKYQGFGAIIEYVTGKDGLTFQDSPISIPG